MPSFLLKDSARSALLALVLFAVWPLLLALGLATWRGIMMLFAQQPITSFPSGTKHGSDAYWRYNRAHANVTENVGIVASILLVGALSGLDTWAFRTLPFVVVGGRVVQSLAHVSSGSSIATWIRFTAFATQVGALLWIAVELVKHLWD